MVSVDVLFLEGDRDVFSHFLAHGARIGEFVVVQ
jgi:hypothetical protein